MHWKELFQSQLDHSNDWMATTGSTQYYISRKQPVRPTIQAVSLKYKQEWAENILDDSIYIFPNPPSSLGSPTQHSDVSALTDYTFFGLSEPKSPVNNGNGIHTPNGSPLTPLTPLEDVRQLEWTRSDASDIHRGIHDRADRYPRRELITRRCPRESHIGSPSANFQRTLSAGIKDSFSESSWQPHLQLPFLSFITSVLSVDDATLQLLSQAPSRPAPFTGQTGPGLVDDEAHVELHGVEKLLLRASESRVVKEGCAVVSDPSIPYGPFPSLPLMGLWEVVTDLMVNGSKAVQEVLRSS